MLASSGKTRQRKTFWSDNLQWRHFRPNCPSSKLSLKSQQSRLWTSQPQQQRQWTKALNCHRSTTLTWTFHGSWSQLCPPSPSDQTRFAVAAGVYNNPGCPSPSACQITRIGAANYRQLLVPQQDNDDRKNCRRQSKTRNLFLSCHLPKTQLSIKLGANWNVTTTSIIPTII